MSDEKKDEEKEVVPEDQEEVVPRSVLSNVFLLELLIEDFKTLNKASEIEVYTPEGNRVLIRIVDYKKKKE